MTRPPRCDRRRVALPWWLCGLLLWLAQGATAVQAQERVRLEDVVAQARTAPSAIHAAMAALRRELRERDRLAGGRLPALTVEGVAGVVYDNRPVLPGPPVIRFDSTTLGVSGSATAEWTLLDAARRRRIQAADARAKQQEQTVEEVRRAAVWDATQLFFRARAAQLLVDEADTTLARRSEQLQAIAGLVDAGRRPIVDQQRATLEVVAARHALDIRRVEARSLGIGLAVAMGREPTQPVRPDPEDTIPVPPRALEDVVKRGTARHPTLARLQAGVQAREAEHGAALASRWPTLGLSLSGSAGYNDIRSGNGVSGHLFGGTAAAFVRWRGLDPTIWREARVAEAALDQARFAYEHEALGVRADVTQAALEVERTGAALAQAEELLASASVVREAQDARYQRGLSSVLELLDAAALEQQSRVGRIEADLQSELAVARLALLCGELD